MVDWHATAQEWANQTVEMLRHGGDWSRIGMSRLTSKLILMGATRDDLAEVRAVCEPLDGVPRLENMAGTFFSLLYVLENIMLRVKDSLVYSLIHHQLFQARGGRSSHSARRFTRRRASHHLPSKVRHTRRGQ